jgi:hypothetical protein
MKNYHSSNDNLNHALYNISNYNPKINCSIQDILNKFISIIMDFMKCISEKISMKNKPYFNFIFERGVETLIHVFSVIFYYTKNLDLTAHHTQQSYYFYIEYIEQISDDNATFLQLTSRDAIIFVYKKTIYNINNEYRKNMQEPLPEDKTILSTLDLYISIYKNIIHYVINHKEFNYDNKTDYINSSRDNIKLLSDSLNKCKIKKPLIDCIFLFTEILEDKQISNTDYFAILNNFIKHLRDNKKIDDKLVKNRIYDCELNVFVDNNNISNINEYIFSN